MEKDLALIEQFLDALWLEKNLAENTLSAYRRDLTMLVEWLAHRELTLESVQHDDLQALLGDEQVRSRSHAGCCTESASPSASVRGVRPCASM